MLPSPREGDSPFIPGTTLQYAWDSTSLTMLQTCPKLYEYQMIQGYRRRGESVHLFFGGQFAKALEHYHVQRAQGASHGYATEYVVGELLEATWIEDKPWDSQHSKKTRETLIRSVVWYLDHYKDDPTKTVILADGKPAVELSFRFDSGIAVGYIKREPGEISLAPGALNFTDGVEEPANINYVLSGHLDRVVDFGGELFVQDQKTTGSTLGSYFFSEFNPHTQMSLYTLASRVVFNTLVRGVMIDAAQIAVGFTAFARSITMRSEDQLEEWLENIAEWLRLAERFASTGKYPRNESSCHKFGGCPFRDICSKSPVVRQQFLDTDFENTNPWNPLKAR